MGTGVGVEGAVGTGEYKLFSSNYLMIIFYNFLFPSKFISFSSHLMRILEVRNWWRISPSALFIISKVHMLEWPKLKYVLWLHSTVKYFMYTLTTMAKKKKDFDSSYSWWKYVLFPLYVIKVIIFLT